MPPNDSTVRRFLLGLLPPADAERVAAALDPAAVTRCAANDTVLAALREAPPPEPDTPELCRLVAALENLSGGEPDAVAGGRLVPADSGTLTTPPLPDAGDTEADLTGLFAPAQAADEIGRLGGFKVLRELGRGGMGAVFAGEDLTLGRKVALKVMLPRVAGNPTSRGRFVREAKAAAAVEHDHIVPVYHVGEDRGTLYLAMPLLPGESLAARLGRGPLAVPDVLAVGGQIADGLAAAHAHDLIHRDVKPGNVWLEAHPDGGFRRVRLLDFGLARLAREADHLTRSGAVLGTPAYMAPEQARGLPVDARADVFSLGCVLYQMATGVRPFTGADTMAVLTAIALDNPPPPAGVNPLVPPRLSALVMRMLEKSPDLRPQSARAVADELAAIGAGAAPVPAPAAEPAGGRSVAPAPRPRRAPWWVAAGLLLAAGGALAAFAPTVVRVATNKGELVLVVDDPNLEVTVKQNGAEVADKSKGRAFVLTAGDGEVEFYDPDTGAKAFTKTFRIVRGGRDVLTAGVADVAAARAVPAGESDPAKAPAPDAALTAEQRKALEWVLANGGYMRVTAGGQHKQLTAEADLPAALHAVVILRTPEMTDTTVENLRHVPALGGSWAHLDVRGTKLTDAGLAKLSGFPALAGVTQLGLSETVVGDAGLVRVKGFRHLTALALRNTRVTDAGMEHLSGLKLEHLDLAGCDGVTGEGFRHLRGITTLRTLDIYRCPVSGERLADLKALRLSAFTGANCREIGDVGLNHLAAIPTLETLNLSGAGVTDAGVKGVGGLTQLAKFDLGYNPGVTDASAATLAALPGVEHLILFRAGLTDAGLGRLAGCRSLKELDVRATKVTAAGVKSFVAAAPGCRVLWDGGTIEPTQGDRP